MSILLRQLQRNLRRCGRPPPTALDGQDVAIAEQLSAPHAPWLAVADRLLKAQLEHRAGGTDPLGLLDVTRLVGEEDIRHAPARRLLPVPWRWHGKLVQQGLHPRGLQTAADFLRALADGLPLGHLAAFLLVLHTNLRSHAAQEAQHKKPNYYCFITDQTFYFLPVFLYCLT
ncbi:uncharacterized protein METZ01_LOCUS463908 [marine metagenome]|uniref:Uncharacterized protein n=1 Tax=marine metagenome TaxID=408172 RepID=A0A383ATQ3_9ZZZZ